MTANASEIPGQEGALSSLTIEVEEDIEQEIESFVRFKRRGEYEKAEEIFKETLSGHLSLFPVIAEYADLLLVQEKYRILSEFLDIQIQYMEPVLGENEIELLRILRSLVHIHTRGSLRSALIQANRTWNFLHSRSTKLPLGALPGDVEIHIFAIYINIIVFALNTSNWVGPEEMKCPWALDKHSDHCGFVQWYLVLSCNGHLWSASQVLVVLLQALPLLRAEDVVVLFGKECFGEIPSEESLRKLSEIDQLTAGVVSFSRAQALLNLVLTLFRGSPDDFKWREVYKVALRYRHVADFLATIITRHDEAMLLEFKSYIQSYEFQRVHKALIEPMLSATSLSTDLGSLKSPPNLFQQDPRCYILCYSQRLIEDFPEFRRREISINFASPAKLQLHDQGNSIGFIRTWDLCCTLMGNVIRGEDAQFEKASLSSELDSFLPVARSTDTTIMIEQLTTKLAIQLWKEIQHIIPEEISELKLGHSVEQRLSFSRDSSESFNIPLYLWAMHKDLEILNVRLRQKGTKLPGLSESYVAGIRDFLPKSVSRECLSHIATLVLETSQEQSWAERRADKWQKMAIFQPKESDLGPIPTPSSPNPSLKEPAEVDRKSFLQRDDVKESSASKEKFVKLSEELPEGAFPALETLVESPLTGKDPIEDQTKQKLKKITMSQLWVDCAKAVPLAALPLQDIQGIAGRFQAFYRNFRCFHSILQYQHAAFELYHEFQQTWDECNDFIYHRLEWCPQDITPQTNLLHETACYIYNPSDLDLLERRLDLQLHVMNAKLDDIIL
ncbi:uncharacterized protein N7482_010463 [Penicillium canariense]|uniref:Uncharacterized protein n=1 Tax=Penicillium canariense TaxID=189055 RepID=A0A9W9HKJ5_9EURO|nr:uncharacterized protein N7482_010463 [Penicillium canariense]KAJ5151211.1 hypothetical protein N7482_010463 [Penicillium canariense]